MFLYKKRALLFIVSGLILGSQLFTASPAQAGGPFYNTLKSKFCDGKPYGEYAGCWYYVHYRIKDGRTRDDAFKACIWGCNKAMNTPERKKACEEACQATKAKDN